MPGLTTEFFTRSDVTAVARDLLGKVLATDIEGERAAAIITETEAYAGVGDRASHAYGGRRTQRTEPMYAEGGIAYVYLCYGIHHLFNVVTSTRDDPKAVLVRAGLPHSGFDVMRRRRGRDESDPAFTAGPGSLSQALGIRTEMTGTDLSGKRIWIEDRQIDVPPGQITVGPRVGIDYAGDDAMLPYRFRVAPRTVQAWRSRTGA